MFYEFGSHFKRVKKCPNGPKVTSLLIETYFSVNRRPERSPAVLVLIINGSVLQKMLKIMAAMQLDSSVTHHDVIVHLSYLVSMKLPNILCPNTQTDRLSTCQDKYSLQLTHCSN